MLAETNEERAVRRLLGGFGYEVERLEEGATPIADYLARRAGEHLLVEVKAREPDHEFARQLEETGRAGSERPIARLNSLSGRVGDAVKQLRATKSDDDVLRLMAFVAPDDEAQLHVDQFQKTLYGTVDVLRDAGGAAQAVPCFYFTYSEFYRYRDLDGAIVLRGSGARLCINDLSPRADLLRQAELTRIMAQAEAVTDPVEVEAAGEGYVADCDCPRDGEDAEAEVLDFVRAKYGEPKLITFQPIRVRAAVKVPYEHTGPES